MIFATTGTQLPFDRLLLGLDTWAARNLSIPIVAQAGLTSHRFRHLQTVTEMPQSDFRRHFQAARLVVAHAGMGTILSALELGIPLIIMPRRTQFGEHRNDHQQDTAREMSRFSQVVVAGNGEELHIALDQALASDFANTPATSTAGDASAPLLETLRDFVWASHPEPGYAVRHAVRSKA
jgi:UDP-N-acetylglucosamine transferase subunit ALG13